MAPSPRDRTGIALAILSCLLLYWQAVFGRGYFYERDVWLYWVPHIEWASRALASGRLPQWNAFKGFGTPFLADPNFQFFYPPSILNWILPANAAYTVLVTGHSIFGALGAYRLLSGRLRSPLSALVGAVVFVASGPVVSSANLWHHFCAVMFMPWILDAFLRLRARRGGVSRLGLLTGLQALSGSADVCLMTGVALALLLPMRLRRLRDLAPRLGASFVLCCGLAAVQWIPTAMLAGRAARSSLAPETRQHWSVAPESLIDMVVPMSGVAHAVPGSPDYAEQHVRLIPWMYLGASTLPLIFLGMRRAPRAFLLLLFALLLSLGRHTPIGEVLGSLPVASSLRFPSKVLWLVTACWAVLAAIGHREIARRPSGTNRFLVSVGVILMGAALSLFAFAPTAPSDNADWIRIWRFIPWAPLALGSVLIAVSSSRRAALAAALVVGIDLLVPGQTYNAYASGEMFKIRPSLVDELQRQKAERVHVFQASRPVDLAFKVPDGWSEEQAYYFAQAQFLAPPQSTRWSIKGSFDGDFTGLASAEYSTLVGIAGSGETLQPNLLRLAGVTHAIRFPGRQPLELPLVASIPTFHAQPVLVLSVPDPRPLSYVVHRVRSEPSLDAAIRAVTDPSFDSAREVVRVQDSRGLSALTGMKEAPSPEARIEIEEEGRWVVRARLEAPGTLVNLMAYSEGWTALVDGKPARIQRANVLFQSVDLDAGEHTVELRYETPGLWLAFGVSLVTWVLLALANAGPPRKKNLDSAA